jgi:hypothetical protein
MVQITRSVATERLGDVAQEKRFWCVDGRYLKNLQELKDALQNMTDETFSIHSNATKSDFSNWVKDVIGDDKLATDLKKSVTRAQAARSVADRISWLKKKAAG